MFSKVIKRVKRLLSNLIIDPEVRLDTFHEDYLVPAPKPTEEVALESEEESEEEEEIIEVIDLEPVAKFMEDYIGVIIIDISGHEDFAELAKITTARVISNVSVDGQAIKFDLTNLTGDRAGSLKIIPSKYGMFTEKLPEEGLELNSVYRITFYGGHCLEYLDTQGSGQLVYQE